MREALPFVLTIVATSALGLAAYYAFPHTHVALFVAIGVAAGIGAVRSKA